jgi:hypothetical protein
MADYFSDFSNLASNKGLPAPADTPYETPSYIRSKRSSRATLGDSSREQSASPPPLPIDTSANQEKSQDGLRTPVVDPRRFTPTLHASLVSEILTLRRELDSKNNLVENLESSLSSAKNENEVLAKKYSDSTREVRKAKQAVQQMEQGTLEAVEDLIKDRDEVHAVNEDLRTKLEALQKKVRQQDEDAARTQTIWENEKEAFDSERRQLERRLHVTESRLRAFVDEMTAQQSAAAAVVHIEEPEEEVHFKDSALGNDSDTASIHSATTPMKSDHRRNGSAVSTRSRHARGSMISRHLETPEPIRPAGNSLADELEDDEEFDDEFDAVDEEVEYTLATPARHVELREIDHRNPRIVDARQSARVEQFQRGIESRQSLRAEPFSTPKRNAAAASLGSPTKSSFTPAAASPLLPPPNIVAAVREPARRAEYVDRGYQPSPPSTPPRVEITSHDGEAAIYREDASGDDVFAVKPASVVAEVNSNSHDVAIVPVLGDDSAAVAKAAVDEISTSDSSRALITHSSYTSTSTQTDIAEPETVRSHKPKQDSLSPASFVPAIAIHPPSSRPSSPRPAVLPPGTKNASAQTDLPWPGVDASMQTEEIRVDKRIPRLAAHLLPSPTLVDSLQSKRASVSALVRNISIRAASSFDFQYSPTVQSPESSRENTRDGMGSRDVVSPHVMPLKAFPLPRPVLSPPPATIPEAVSNGPLNRSAQYGVKQTRKMSLDEKLQRGDDTEGWSDNNNSDYDDLIADLDLHDDVAGDYPVSVRAATTGVSEAIESSNGVAYDEQASSYGKRPTTASSYGAAPAPSVSSSRAPSRTQMHSKRGSTSNTKGHRSRSPSFASAISSSYSTQSVPAVPPYPIPLRSSSKTIATALSDGTSSPTPGSGSNRYSSAAQAGLRKVQSAAIIRGTRGKNPSSPTTTKIRRRRLRSPDLTPVQSMAFDSPPITTDFPIPDLPIPLVDGSTLEVPAPLSVQEVTVPGPQMTTPMSPVHTNHATASAAAAAAAASQVEPPNLVDAIAATMVGEWMWKYIRKRKSFGIGEDSSAEVSVPLPPGHHHAGSSTGSMGSASTSSNTLNIQAHGTRHKRWVWLSPYERTIMWDNKQPTSGQALLGKKGRKLAIQSVLDVQDPTPLPAKPELRSAFARSILILTPERALKFTAIDLERHMLWMTALTFLAQNNNTAPHGVPMSPTMPSSNNPAIVPRRLQPPPAPESNDGLASPTTTSGRDRSPSFGRSNVRDSIRLAKAKSPETGPIAVATTTTTSDAIPTDRHHEASVAAEPPSVPRLYVTTSKHQRKRSNTLGTSAYHPRLPSSIRNFSSPTPTPIIIPKASAAVMSNGPQSAGLTAPASSAPPYQNSYYTRSGAGTAATYTPKTYHTMTPSYSSSYAYSGAASTASNSGYLSDHHTTTSSSRHHRNNKSSSNSNTTTTSPTAPNFFEAVGTVRMEAFVDHDVDVYDSQDFHMGSFFGGGAAAPSPGVARSYTDGPAIGSSSSKNNNMLYIPAGMPFNQASSGLRYQTGSTASVSNSSVANGSSMTGTARTRGDSGAGSSGVAASYRQPTTTTGLTAAQAGQQMQSLQSGFVFDDGTAATADPFKGF